ncbi:undecaprenyl-diphosphatase [Kribbella orskensis]|uniref:Undecaprenyl-diphosphatase n=1 Tax=Kribbella orskensis TaxID=2512216 RepID=A0ABY2BT66_9ACTN|nr:MULTISPECIES: phosphatase PAP2 family protein [Kribbella]TCN42805.1 undecaprenyl-diphosphatase [Kribbella sp. VKM Ac-2500]TCO29839.1 undecaprenyl-diphosphatase [Kribbella orskensis]
MTTDNADPARLGERGRKPAVIPALRGPAVVLMVLGALLLVVPALLYAGDSGPNRIDRWIQPAVNTPAGVWQVALTVDWTGEPAGRVVTVLIVAALCLLTGRRRLALVAVLGPFLTTVLALVLKQPVDRRIHGDFLSYPSGHTAAATAIGLVLGLLAADLLKAGRLVGTALVLGLAVICGGLMAWAQIDLTAHYPTDTIGGFGAALLVVLATALLIDRFAGRRQVTTRR